MNPEVAWGSHSSSQHPGDPPSRGWTPCEDVLRKTVGKGQRARAGGRSGADRSRVRKAGEEDREREGRKKSLQSRSEKAQVRTVEREAERRAGQGKEQSEVRVGQGRG